MSEDPGLQVLDLADDTWDWGQLGHAWLPELLRRDWERAAYLQGREGEYA